MADNLTRLKKCDSCISESFWICFQCKKYYCDKCYKIIHDLKSDNPHEKTKINPYLSIDFFCPNHQEYPLELFCFNDKGNFHFIIN